MKTYIYEGSMNLIGKSGVGKAIEHQKMLLGQRGIEIDKHMSKADIVHINTVLPDSVVTAINAKLHGKTVVYYGHSTMEDFRDSFVGSNVLAPLFKKWITFCYNLGDVVITPTEYSKSVISTYGIKKPIYAVSNGIDTSFWRKSEEGRKKFREKYHLSDDKKVIMSVGHFIERKGIIEFIEMAKKMPEAMFFWCGYTNPSIITPQVKEAVKQAPKNVVFTGFLNQDELLEVYQGSDLFCFMSHEETEGIVVLEALAAQIPVIVRDIPVYKGWLEDRKNVYMCNELDEFITTANGILNHTLPSLVINGHHVAYSRKYSEISRQMIDIYRTYAHTNETIYDKMVSIGGK